MNDYGKIPPQDIKTERAIIGSIILQQDAFALAADWINEDVFYNTDHKTIFRNCRELHDKGIVIDILSLSKNLRKNNELEGIGGAVTLSELTEHVGSTANLEYNCLSILEHYIGREIIRITSEINQEGYSEETDHFNLLEKLERNLDEINRKVSGKKIDSTRDLIPAVLKDLEKPLRVDGLIGVGCGFTKIDRHTGGYVNGDLDITAARPGMGKTAYILNMALNQIKLGYKPLIFSVEMQKKKLVERLMSISSGIPYDRIRKRQLEQADWQILHSRITIMVDSVIYIDDTSLIDITELRAKAHFMKRKHGIDIIYVDYLQLVTHKTDKTVNNRAQSVGLISRQLKKLAKDLDVPVHALAQMNREFDKRGSKRPLLSDLGESGDIERDADSVTFLYRPEYYGETHDEDGHSLAGVAEIINAKGRNGDTFTERLYWKGDCLTFSDEPTPF